MIEIFMANRIRPPAIGMGDQVETVTVYDELGQKICWDRIVCLYAKFTQKKVGALEVMIQKHAKVE